MPYGVGTYGVDTYASLYIDHGLRVGVPATILADHGIRVALPASVVVDHGSRVSFNALVCDHGIRVSVPLTVLADHGMQISLLQTQVRELFPPTGFSSSYYYKYGTRIVFHDSVKGDKDVTQYVTDWSVSMSRGEPTTFSLKLLDRDRKLRPYLEPTDEYYDLFDGANYDDNNNVKRYLTIEVSLHGQVHMYPYFMATDYTWDLNEQGVAEVSLSGSDFSELLLEEDQATEDYITGDDSRITYTLRYLVSQTLIRNGITADRQRLEFTDMRVHRFTPSGTPLDTIRDLLYYAQAEWFWDRDVFVARDRGYSPTGSGHWTLVDTNHVLKVNVKRSNRGIFNEFTGTKTEAYSNILAEYDCRGPDCLGRHSISFDVAHGAALRVKEVACGVWKNTDWFLGGAESGTYLGHGAATLRRTDTVTFVYEQFPPPFFTCVEPRFRAVVVGRREGDIPTPAGWESAFQCTVSSAASQAKYGKRKDKSPITSTVWATQEDCKRTLRLLLEESARTAFVASVECPLLPDITPAKTVRVVNGYAGSTEGENYYIESVDASGGSDGVFSMSLSLTRYRPEDL